MPHLELLSQRTSRSLVRLVSAVAVTCVVSVGSVVALETTTAGNAAATAVPADTDGYMPVYAHMPDPTAVEIKKRIDAGWATGAFLYYKATDDPFGWTSRWDDLEETFPNGVDLFVSPKNFTTASLTDWAERLSPAQRAKTVFAYWQEPEENFTTDAERAAFRAKVVQAADIVQPFGIRNGIELQAWTLNEGNKTEWGGADNFKAFFPADTSKLDYVGISLYDYHQNFSGAKQLKPVKVLLNRNLPHAEWGPLASGWSVPAGTPQGAPIRAERAAAAADGFAWAKKYGADSYGWFDFPAWDGTKDYAVDGDPALLAVLTAL